VAALLSQYANSSGQMAYCYAELAVSSPAVAEIIASTCYIYPLEGWPG